MRWLPACASLALGAPADWHDSDSLHLLQLAAVPHKHVQLALAESTYGAGYLLDGRGVPGGNKRIPAPGATNVTRLQNLQWLHVPKSGTSFMATIWAYACGQGEKPIDLAVDVKYTPQCQECYDFALMDRYPKSVYCDAGVLAEQFQTQHRPVTSSIMDDEHVVGLFRKPSQRIVSAAKAMHLSGFSSSSQSELHAACVAYATDPSGFYKCFATYPGVAGCITRMLTGESCASDPSTHQGEFDGALSRVADAKAAMEKMAFVGLTDRWDESVCLFHLMFGGGAYTAEFQDIHASATHSDDYEESLLGDFRDEADEQLYAHAVKLFQAQLQRYVPQGKRACDLVLDKEAIAKAAAIDCDSFGAECGGAERFDCGVCPQRRTEFCTGFGDVGEIECAANKCGGDGDLFKWKNFEC